MKEKKQVDPYKYGYDKDSNWIIPAEAGLMEIDFMNEIVASQPNVGALMMYPKSTEEIKDEDGNLVYVKITWAEHTPTSFFNTASMGGIVIKEDGTEEVLGGIPFMTSLAYKAEQLKHSLTAIHLDNINRGVAKPLEELKEKDVLQKLS